MFSGKPSPAIKWWRGERLIDSIETRSGFENVRSNQLVIRGLQRSDQHAIFTCQASNNNISQPVSAKTAIEIYCKYTFFYFLHIFYLLFNSYSITSTNNSFIYLCGFPLELSFCKVKWIDLEIFSNNKDVVTLHLDFILFLFYFLNKHWTNQVSYRRRILPIFILKLCNLYTQGQFKQECFTFHCNESQILVTGE